MTPTPEKALKAADEPKLIKPRSNSITIPKIKELKGIPRVLFTFFNHREPGRARSRAKAQVHREVEVTQVIPLQIPRIMTGRHRQKAPAEFPVALRKIVGIGSLNSASMPVSGRTNAMGMR